MTRLSLFFLCWLCSAQAINCGGPDANGFQADAFFVGGNVFSKAGLAAPLDTMRFGPQVVYHVPEAPGIYVVTLQMVEPSYTVRGKRLISIDVNGQQVKSVDPFALAQAQANPSATVIVTTFSGTGTLYITLTSEIAGGNAILSAITISSASALFGFQYGTGQYILLPSSPVLQNNSFLTILASRAPGPSGDCTDSLGIPDLMNAPNSPRPFAVVSIDSFSVCGPDPAAPDRWVWRRVASWP